MTNQVHLVVQANDNLTAIPQLMKRLADRQTHFVNALEKRSGSLWEGRYKISPIDTDVYLLVQGSPASSETPVGARNRVNQWKCQKAVSKTQDGFIFCSFFDLSLCGAYGRGVKVPRIKVPENTPVLVFMK